MAVAEPAAVEDMMMIATCSLTAKNVRLGNDPAKAALLTVERPRIDEPENTLRGQGRVHGIAEPVRQDEQEKRRHRQRLRLEVVDLGKDARTHGEGQRGTTVGI